MSSSRPGTTYHVILPNVLSTAVLALSSPHGLHLPRWLSDREEFWQDTRPILRTMKKCYGLSVAVLRAAALEWSAGGRDSYYILELIGETPESMPVDAHWLDVADVDRVQWDDDEDRRLVNRWIEDRSADNRVAWYLPGWHEKASNWMLDALAAAGITATGPIEQLRSWERSSIMRIETNAGFAYFKAVPQQWGHEPPLTDYLASQFPDVMPEIIAFDPANRWMLVREFRGIPLSESRDIARWKRAYRSLARVQRKLADCLQSLENLGLPLRDANRICAGIPAVLRDQRRMRLGLEQGLTGTEAMALLDVEDRLVSACRRLACGPIPLSIDHGDFWLGNIFAGKQQTTLIDWSDATISHPFFSLVMARDEIGPKLPDYPGACHEVIDAYLSEWRDYGSLADLRAIYEDAMLIAPIHQALMYSSTYLPAMEFADELDRMTPHFLRWLARRL